MAKLVTNTFFIPLDPKRVLIAADTKENRLKYERLAYETVYFPGLDNAEVTEVGQYRAQRFRRAAGRDLPE